MRLQRKVSNESRFELLCPHSRCSFYIPENQMRLENLGFRRRRGINGNRVGTVSTRSISSTLPKDAKYMPAPPGIKPSPILPAINLPVNNFSSGDSLSCSTNKSIR